MINLLKKSESDNFQIIKNQILYDYYTKNNQPQKAKSFQSVNIKNSIAASDAFFPFTDGVKTLIKAGVKIIVQPGGSIRDQEIINAADKAKVKMFFTGVRHFNH